MKMFQKGFNYSQDGDGNRLVYHLQGCNMICPWCSNPEGRKVQGSLMADPEWMIDEICPYGAIHAGHLDREKCETCAEKICVTQHNTKGMMWSCTEATVEELLREIEANEMMFYDGGGVTFTGGEATIQFQELKEVLKGAKKRAINTAIETNGTHPGLPELFPYIDQLIIDCKSCDEAKHLKYTGVPFAVVKKNLEQAAKQHDKVHIRVPLIGGVNDSPADREKMLKMFEKLAGENVTFEVLSYHAFGEKKWAACGWEYTMTKEAYVSQETKKEFISAIKEKGGIYKAT